LQQQTVKALASAESAPETIRQSSLALGITNGYFSSIANGQSLNDDIRDYYFTILRSINDKWWIGNTDHAGAKRRALINVVIARDGKVLQAEIVQGSGSFSYDRSLLKALEAAGPFPPLPERYQQVFFLAPLLFNPPLNLMTSVTS
jgi:protein TonB